MADLTALAVFVVGLASMLYGSRLVAIALAAEPARPEAGAGAGAAAVKETSVMVEILQLAIMTCAVLALLAVVQPFLRLREGVAIALLTVAAIMIVLWHGARRLAAARA